MKPKIDRNSIKFRTWLYFILFAAGLMLVLWIMQVFLFNSAYGTMKETQTREVVRDINQSFKKHDTEKFLHEIGELSDSYDMYIYVVSYDGKTQYFSPSAEDYAKAPSFETDYSGDGTSSDSEFISKIQTLNEHMIRNNGSAYVKIEGNDKSQVILAYGGVLTLEDKEPLIVYVFSPLWPVNSTVQILTNQLVAVSIVALIIACCISIYLSTRITRPIRKISATAQRLAQGEYGIVFRGGHYTELNNLADTLTGASIELEKSLMLQKDLVANVSHDLRTPLTMIKSYAEMIRDISGDNPDKRNEHLKVIIEETDRLNGLVGDLLTVSRLQSGKMVLDISEFSLTEAVESILNTYKVMEMEQDYRIEFNCSSNYIVRGDEEKLKQVVSNLVSNAVKFSGEEKHVIVSLRKKGRYVQFRVSDSGPGIPPEELDHVWERYYRSSSNMVRSAEGTGLGLAICKEILSLHKTDFGVSSTLGEGSEFWFDAELVRTDKLNTTD